MEPKGNIGVIPHFAIPGLLMMTGASPYWVGMTMFRIQEFYESKHSQLRRKCFSLETAMDLYAKPSGIFDYADQFHGFNVPGHILDEFARLYSLHREPLTQKERCLYEFIKLNLDRNKTPKYYLIGVSKDSDPRLLAHEICHARYYLDQNYHDLMEEKISAIPARDWEIIAKYLDDNSYHRDVFRDEAQAYLSTNSKKESQDMFPGIDPETIRMFRN